jgi:hypothetical protein
LSAHTPGPWERETRPDSGGAERPIVVGDGDLVCAVSRRGLARQEAEANARLIAAAPDLLAASKAIEAALTDLDVDFEPEDDLKRALNAVRAAVAKAEVAS